MMVFAGRKGPVCRASGRSAPVICPDLQGSPIVSSGPPPGPICLKSSLRRGRWGVNERAGASGIHELCTAKAVRDTKFPSNKNLTDARPSTELRTNGFSSRRSGESRKPRDEPITHSVLDGHGISASFDGAQDERMEGHIRCAGFSGSGTARLDNHPGLNVPVR